MSDSPAKTLPPAKALLFVPAHPRERDGQPQVGIELRLLRSGGMVCLAFTSVEKLVASLGRWQPWIGLPESELRAELVRMGVAELYVDSGMPADAWRWDARQLQVLSDGVAR